MWKREDDKGTPDNDRVEHDDRAEGDDSDDRVEGYDGDDRAEGR